MRSTSSRPTKSSEHLRSGCNSPHPHGAAHRPHVFGVPRQWRVDGIGPLGRYRTFPGARMQLYSNPFMQTVDPRHVRGRPLARTL